MTLVEVHKYFDFNEAQFLYLKNYDEATHGFKHCVYKLGTKMVTIPKVEPGDIKPEIIAAACKRLGIPTPSVIDDALGEAG